jgi:hypothetical protein
MIRELLHAGIPHAITAYNVYLRRSGVRIGTEYSLLLLSEENAPVRAKRFDRASFIVTLFDREVNEFEALKLEHYERCYLMKGEGVVWQPVGCNFKKLYREKKNQLKKIR